MSLRMMYLTFSPAPVVPKVPFFPCRVDSIFSVLVTAQYITTQRERRNTYKTLVLQQIE